MDVRLGLLIYLNENMDNKAVTAWRTTEEFHSLWLHCINAAASGGVTESSLDTILSLCSADAESKLISTHGRRGCICVSFLCVSDGSLGRNQMFLVRYGKNFSGWLVEGWDKGVTLKPNKAFENNYVLAPKITPTVIRVSAYD